MPQPDYSLASQKPVQNEYVLAGAGKTKSPLDRGFGCHMGNASSPIG
ncbi:hypothetical protein [Endozoicomonas sp. 4G]|nr:hypothetical protein [Endozoicomonas sp. 4G]